MDAGGPEAAGRAHEGAVVDRENPVVPYPVERLEVAPDKIDEAYTKSALLEVALVPRKNSGVRAQMFFLELKKVGAGGEALLGCRHWVPRGAAVVPR